MTKNTGINDQVSEHVKARYPQIQQGGYVNILTIFCLFIFQCAPKNFLNILKMDPGFINLKVLSWGILSLHSAGSTVLSLRCCPLLLVEL